MLQDPLAEKWKRIPSLDGLASLLAEQIDDLDAIYLGAGSDQLPLFALAHKGSLRLCGGRLAPTPISLSSDSEGPTALVIAGGAGDSVIGLAAAVSLLSKGGLPGYKTFIICGLDAARLRHNDTQLGQLKPSPAEHAAARRLAWGSGEDPELGLPIRFGPLMQPDQLPEDLDGISCSPEALALARALKHLSPSLVISLRDIPSGGIQLACSQQLPETDWASLMESVAVAGAVPDFSPELINKGIPSSPGCLVLSSLDDQVKHFSEDQLAIGPVSTWQFMQAQNPEAVYLAAYLPRLSTAQLGDQSPSGQLRSVTVKHEIRLRKGNEQRMRIEILEMTGHPADQAELRVEKADQDSLGLMENQPAKKGWLAVEAMLLRQAYLASALRAFQDVLEHMESDEHQRGIQVLQSAIGIDQQMIMAQTNSFNGQLATQADWAYWKEVYSYQTSLILSESLRCLRYESQADPRISDLRQHLQGLIDHQLSETSLLPLAAQDLAQASLDFALCCAKIMASGGPELTRAEAACSAADQQLFEARRFLRDAKQMKLPPTERQQAQLIVEQAEQVLTTAQNILQAVQLIAEVSTDSQGTHQESEIIQIHEPAPEEPEVIQAPDLIIKQTEAIQAPDPALAEPEIIQIPEPALAEPEAEQQEPEAAQATFRHKKSDPNPDFDIEPLLPSKLEIPPEWGRGPLLWKDQLPKRNQQPMLRELARSLTAQDPVLASATEMEVVRPGQEMQPIQKRTLPARETHATGWIRKRTELTGRYSLDPDPQPKIVSSDGNWRQFSRSVS